MACMGMAPQETGLKQMRSERPIHNTWSGQDLVFMFCPGGEIRVAWRTLLLETQPSLAALSRVVPEVPAGLCCSGI